VCVKAESGGMLPLRIQITARICQPFVPAVATSGTSNFPAQSSSTGTAEWGRLKNRVLRILLVDEADRCDSIAGQCAQT
jgi:hypothetical protein